jgi:5,5'-dehydrodivanillate O-demethylase
MDRTGNVLETPGEPDGSDLQDKVKQPAYPAQELGGLIFTYLGPKPVPDLPRFHMLAAEGQRSVMIQGFNDCNFLQCLENGIDAHHVAFLHGDTWAALAPEPEKTWFEPHEFGVVVKTIASGRAEGEFAYRQHPVILPGISIGGDTVTAYGSSEQKKAVLPATTARWTVPIDDTHTLNFRIWFRPEGQQKSALELRTHRAEPVRIEPYREYKEGRSELGYEEMTDIYEQDATVFDGSGKISDRENEHLYEIDDGIIMLREIFLEQIEAVRQGLDPIGVVRNTTDQMLVLSGDYQWIDSAKRDSLIEGLPSPEKVHA